MVRGGGGGHPAGHPRHPGRDTAAGRGRKRPGSHGVHDDCDVDFDVIDDFDSDIIDNVASDIIDDFDFDVVGAFNFDFHDFNFNLDNFNFNFDDFDFNLDNFGFNLDDDRPGAVSLGGLALVQLDRSLRRSGRGCSSFR